MEYSKVDARGYMAEIALADAVSALGLSVGGIGPDAGADMAITTPDGQVFALEVKMVALASVDGLERRLTRWQQQSAIRSRDQGVVFVLVADRITASAREVLKSAGWGWLDLRGHLHLSAPGLFVDADVPTNRIAEQREHNPFSGRVAIEVAVDLLLSSTEHAVVRRIANRTGRAPSSVSEALARFRSARLIDSELKPRVPELFWDLAQAWKSESVEVASPPPFDLAVTQALRLGLEDSEITSGWALTDSRAAVLYGAPIGLRSGHPEDFYVPDRATQRRAVRLLGPAETGGKPPVTIRVAPVPAVCEQRVDASVSLDSTEHWPLAQPLFVALDLAQDPGRGREVLDGWTPPNRWRRVW